MPREYAALPWSPCLRVSVRKSQPPFAVRLALAHGATGARSHGEEWGEMLPAAIIHVDSVVLPCAMLRAVALSMFTQSSITPVPCTCLAASRTIVPQANDSA